MAEDQKPVKLDVRSKADLKGLRDAKSGMDAFKESVNAANSKAELLGKTLRGAGWLAVIMQVVNAFNRVRSAVESARAAIADMARKAQEKGAAEAIGRQKEAWDELKKSIDAAAAAASRQAEMAALARGGARALEDARSQVEEQRELGAIAPDDPERKEKEDAVRARYTREREITAASRVKEDAALARQQLDIEASEASDAAAAAEGQAGQTAREIPAREAQARHWSAMSRQAMRPSRLARIGLAEPVPLPTKESKEFEAKASKASADAAKLQAVLNDQLAAAKKLREAAELAAAKSAAAFASYRAADISLQAADMKSGRDVRDTGKAVRDAASRRQAEERGLAEKTRRRDELNAAAADMRGRLSGFESAERRERIEADRAGYGYGRLRPRDRAAAEPILRREEQEAREAAAALSAAKSELTPLLTKVLDEAKRLDAEIKQLSRRVNNSRSDAGNID